MEFFGYESDSKPVQRGVIGCIWNAFSSCLDSAHHCTKEELSIYIHVQFLCDTRKHASALHTGRRRKSRVHLDDNCSFCTILRCSESTNNSLVRNQAAMKMYFLDMMVYESEWFRMISHPIHSDGFSALTVGDSLSAHMYMQL